MKTVNQVFLLGRLGQDPEHSTTRQGKEQVKFSLATSYSVRVDDGWEERTDWHKVVAFDWQAKAASDRLRKGDPVAVVGRMRSYKYTDEDGKPRVVWSVVARDLSFMAPRREVDRPPAGSYPPTRSVALPPPDLEPAVLDEDIPF